MKKKAFTLAEVLITLVVIGVIAALTIPALVLDLGKKADVTRLKKAYSVMTDAYKQLTISDGNVGDLSSTGHFDGDFDSAKAWNGFKKKFNVIKDCGTGTGCFPDLSYKDLEGNDDWNLDSDNTNGKGILADGTLIAISDNAGNCNLSFGTGPIGDVCGQLLIDINGFKPPHQYGRDLFFFHITKTGIYPYGTPYDGWEDCDTSNMGVACAGKVLFQGDINY